jgi:uncharacterized BrkB/YihY/UPF0761 family membrane protein
MMQIEGFPFQVHLPILRRNFVMKKETIIKLTKCFLDVMFYGGIVIVATLPFIIRFFGNYYEPYKNHYPELVVIYFVLGIAAIVILRELRKIFQTVIEKNCFVRGNVESLNKMWKWSIFIVLIGIIRTFVYATMGMVIVILVFIIAGLFSKVLAYVFEEAVGYKEENDYTI